MNNERTHETAYIERTRFQQLADAGYPTADVDGTPTVQVPPSVFDHERAQRNRVLKQAKAARKAARKRAAASRGRNR
jgi:hypothetical protein